MIGVAAVVRGLGAGLLSALLALIAFLLVGVFRPIAGVFALCVFVFLTPALYRRMPSTTRDRPLWKRVLYIVALLAIILGTGALLWMFWMIGQAGYNQTVPR